MHERFTVAGLLRNLAAERPEAPMLTEGSLTVTWAEEHQRAGRVAQALAAEGLGPGDRVAFLDRNGIAYFDLLFGGALLGAVNVAVNWRLSPPEMAAVIDDSHAPVLVVHPEWIPCLAQMESRLPLVRRVVVLGTADGGSSGEEAVATLDGGLDAAPEWAARRLVPMAQWLASHGGSDPGFVGKPSTVVLQLYTSGTTGLPKGVMLTNSNLATAVGEAGHTFGVDESTVSLVAMPLFHIGGSGWALCGMSRGGRSIILRTMDPGELVHLVETFGVTDTFVVPAVLMALLAVPGLGDRNLTSLRNIFYGASPIAEDVLVRCLGAFPCRFTQVYGMTETTGAITALLPADHDPGGPRRHLLRSAGRPHPGVELRIVDPDSGEQLGFGQVGELMTRSAYNMAGYWQQPEATEATVSADGWLRTGDAGYLDAGGYLFLHDRIKDMVVSGGENVYPAEVENVLLGHPDVVDAAVFGVPDERWGEAVKALVVGAPGQSVDVEEIRMFCRDRLAHFKCPSSVEVVDTLPRNPSGKILKRELREPYWREHQRRIG